jgi:oligopeptide/dipeptide ABC transporter ATP-binding protein
MIFQDPTSSLNPVFNIGDQVSEGVILHEGLNKKEGLNKAIGLLKDVGIPSAEKRVDEYPHQFSGGMRQRVMIAMALSCNPDLLIADEPTTNLDATIQTQILDLMIELKKKYGSSVLMVTHHLGIVAEMCEKVAVMYAGDIVEYADVVKLFYESQHPYTYALLRCIPRGPHHEKRLLPIEGTVPDLIKPPSGCKFHPRCPKAFDRCRIEKPKLISIGPDHKVACHLFSEA